MNEILIDGYSVEELKKLAGDSEFEKLIFTNEPTVFSAGTAEILGQFHKVNNQLHIDLVHIDGGGEGVLISIKSIIRTYGKLKRFDEIHWYVHATNCHKPNNKLQRILRLKKYELKSFDTKGSVLFKKEIIN